MSVAAWRSIKGQPEDAPVPKIRRYHASVLYKNEVYLFGGQQGSQVFLNDLWVLNAETQTWKELTLPNGPGPRCGHSASIVGNKMYVFGGVANKVTNKEMWILDLDQLKWQQVQPADVWPSARHEHAAVVRDSVILVYGGSARTSNYLRDLWIFSTDTLTWDQVEYADGPKPDERAGPLLAESQNKDVFWLYGGYHGDGGFEYLKDSWTLTLDDEGTAHWAKIDTPEKSPPTARPLSYTRQGHELFLFGGFDGKLPAADLLVFNLDTKTWRVQELWMDSANPNAPSLFRSSKGFQPLARYGHTIHSYEVHDEEGDELVILVICGSSSTYLNDVVRISIEK